jgi:hypothetical protein
MTKQWRTVIFVAFALLFGALDAGLPLPAHARRLRMGGGGGHYVRPYVKKDGTYVAPHYQTNPNGTKLDNWSTKGNVNPYTGKPGTKDPW